MRQNKPHIVIDIDIDIDYARPPARSLVTFGRP